MHKIHICYVISSLSNQGPPNVLFNIVKYMDFDKFEVSIITLVEEQKVSRIEEFRALPIKVIQLFPNSTPNALKMFKALWKTVKQLQPDILHTHCPRSMFLVPLLPKRYKKVETVHIYPGIQQKVMYGKLKGQIVIWLSHFFTKRMDLPIACSESVAQSYWDEQHFQMMSIPNGCSLPLWKRDNKQKAIMRKQLGMRSDLQYFIFIGRFSQEKNPDFIIKGFEALQNKYKNIGLVLLGDGELYNQVITHSNDRILIPGFKSNVYDYLVASDYYISASDVEGLANTLLESMTVGLPCVLSDIPSHQEVIVKAERPFGFLFNNKKLEELLTAMERVLTIDVEETAEYIQRIFVKYYTARHMSEKYQEEYSKLLIKR
ncbi:MAG: glycosyltransferase [Bacteroidales bacterium]|nr:glycosyltransferase [Bacteroidales bacterium]